MSYAALYQFAQELTIPIGRNVFIAKACELTGKQVKVIRSGLDIEKVRGYFVSAENAEHPFVRTCGGSNVIVVARDNNRCWERFVIIKELMHLFDDALHKTSNSQEFHALIEEFPTPQLKRSLQMDSEVRSLLMALALFCPEEARQGYARKVGNQEMTHLQVATELRIPEQFMPFLVSPGYKGAIKQLM